MDSFLTGRFPPSNRDSQLQIIRVTSIIQFEKLSSPSLSRIFKYTDVCRSWFFPISRPSLCVSSSPSTFHIPMRSSMRKLGKWGWISYKGEDIENIVCVYDCEYWDVIRDFIAIPPSWGVYFDMEARRWYNRENWNRQWSMRSSQFLSSSCNTWPEG